MAPPAIGIDGRARPLPHDHPVGEPATVTVAAADPTLCPACGSVEYHFWVIRPQPAHCSPGCGATYLSESAALLCLTCLRATAYVPAMPAWRALECLGKSA